MGLVNDEIFMGKALDLARSQMGRTTPDPMVGAVLVKNDKIISYGYHAQQGTPHAEAMAIKKAGKNAKGSTLYLNLEPCNHYGNNPPCADLIVKSGIKKVVASMKDPNPLVSGNGFSHLIGAGVEVEIGVLNEEAKKLNEHFVKFITKRTPFVMLKSAMSLDGKIATFTGDSKYITNTRSRQYVHVLRVYVDAILTSVTTIKVDDPLMTVRDIGSVKVPKRDPKVIVVDPNADIPLNSNILKKNAQRVLVVVSTAAPKAKIDRIAQKGATIIKMPAKNSMIDLKKLIQVLGKMNIMSIMIEAGGNFAASCLNAGIVDKAVYFIAPKLIGGRNALTPVEGQGARTLKDIIGLKNISVGMLGDDILVEGYL
jgi:diaminohydroxyphosphoribosylaminopyrimidine deaminase / 5-amino-6-(5-phosphoribosylamino)uracil reductase